MKAPGLLPSGPLPGLEVVAHEPAQTDALVRLWRASFEHGVGVTDPHPLAEQRAYFERSVWPVHEVRLALLDGVLVGFVAASAETVNQLYVHVDHLGRGIGSRLLGWAKDASCGRLWLYTFARNRAACRFYERQGFVVAARGVEPGWQLEDLRYEWTRSASEAGAGDRGVG